MGSAVTNPLRSGSSASSRTVQWLQSATAEVWIKFLLALLGLGLAFASALFSTVSRDAGNLWATVILASVSLVLATLVGIVTVPYLARRVAVERLRESFDYDVTRAGIVYVLVTLVIGIAALNTGNNLLYIVVAAMLAAMVVSGVVSAISGRKSCSACDAPATKRKNASGEVSRCSVARILRATQKYESSSTCNS